MAWYRRLENLLRRDRLHREIEREMAFHIEERVDELVASGMTAEDARRVARRQFGNTEVIREQVREADLLTWLESVFKDAGYALRSLRANPMFTAVAVLSLGLGIGANTAIFSLIDAVMLRSLPVRRPTELVGFRLEGIDSGDTFTYPLWEQIRDRQDALAGTFAFSDASFDLSDGGVVRQADGAWVSGDYFGVLGIGAEAGRLLGPGDDVRGGPAVAVLGYGFWQREYGGDLQAVGRSISLNGVPFRIVGVAQEGFTGVQVGRSHGIFIPISAMERFPGRAKWLEARSTWFLRIFGRLRPGSTRSEADRALAAKARGIFEAAVPTHWTGEEQEQFKQESLLLEPAATGASPLRGRYGDALFILLAVVGTVLLIACANVSQLMLSRANSRQAEVAVRLAIGATRPRLIRQMLTESLLLSMLGAGVGLLFARWSSSLILGLIAQSGQSVALDLALDPRVLGFTIAVAVVTGTLFGLAPALRGTRITPQAALRGAGRSLAPDARHRLSKALVAGQIALSLVLVVSASLLVGSFRRVSTLDPGFRSEGVLVVSANWSKLDLAPGSQQGFVRRLLDRVRTLPGVRSAGASLLTPIGGSFWNEFIQVDGQGLEQGRDALAWFNGVTDGYMETLGTRLLEGRDLETGDGEGAAKVALVNETFVRHFMGGDRPLGRTIHSLDHDVPGPPLQIVGVVEDAKYGGLEEETLPLVYLPLEQTELWGPSVELTLRTDGAPVTAIPWVTSSMEEVDPRISLDFTTLRDQIAISLARPRLLAMLSGFFGALALLLAMIGLQGTMSYDVARRRNEIGVRIALGAARTGILGMVARETVVLVGIGVAAGAALSQAATRLIASFLYGVTPGDPGTLVFSAILLGGVAMAAGMLPAWRAAAVDPMTALRQE